MIDEEGEIVTREVSKFVNGKPGALESASPDEILRMNGIAFHALHGTVCSRP